MNNAEINDPAAELAPAPAPAAAPAPRMFGGRDAPLGVRCEALEVRYGRTRALDGLTLDVPAGVAVGLVGRNGAGKSTLFRCIAGAELPRAGRVSASRELPRESFLAQVGFVFDALSAYDWMRVGGALEYIAAVHPGHDPAWCAALERTLDLDRRARIRTLSRGMQARLAFAIGLAHRPGLLLLDEPLLGVDPVSHDTILELLARVRSEQGCTMLIASHQLSDLARLTDRIAFMDRGRVAEVAATDDIVQRTKRVHLRPAPPEGWRPPGEAILCVEREDGMAITVRDFDERVRDAIHAAAPHSQCDIVDLSIAEACADRLRALEVTS